ncbi:MAG: hypothetical protein QM675_06980 [Protaetiibacter sp.]
MTASAPRWTLDGAGAVRTADDAVIALHEAVDGWTLMGVARLRDGRTAIIAEDLGRADGPIAYLVDGDLELLLPKTLERTDADPRGLYAGRSMTEVLGEIDVLRGEFLSPGVDPRFDEVAALFPPITRIRPEGGGSAHDNPHAFLSSTSSNDAVPVYYGRAYGNRLNPEALTPEVTPAIEGATIQEGLVGGWLPTVRLVYPVDGRVSWDSFMFAGVNPPNVFQQPAFYRYLRLDDGRVTEAYYFDSYLPYPFEQNSSAAEFYAELHELHVAWSAHIEPSMRIEVPVPWLSDFVRHALAIDAMTRVGDHPHYGSVTKDYGGGEHDGFQDVFTSSTGSAVEWGMFGLARRYIDNYFYCFVRDDGSIDYRGPEIGQYGRMLTVIAAYVEQSGDDTVLEEHGERIAAIIGLLRRLCREARELSVNDPAHGMLHGRQEADSNFITGDIALHDYQRPYWNNTAEGWRGFRDLGRVLERLGRPLGDIDGAGLLRDAERLRTDLGRAIGRSILRDRDLPYLPTFAGGTEYHIDFPYRATPQSFDDNRVWTELLGSGITDKATVELVTDYLAAHSGSTLGIIGNRKHVVVFLAHGAGYALLQHDMVEAFLLHLYGLIAHCYTRGSWYALECVDMNRERAEHTPYAGAAELVVAPLVKWMLVFEDPQEQALWLAKGTPREWLDDGGRIAVSGAPTRYGTVGYEIVPQLDDDRVLVSVEVDGDPGIGTELRLRLRTPGRRAIARVTVDGAEHDGFDAAGELVVLPAANGRHAVVVEYAPR